MNRILLHDMVAMGDIAQIKELLEKGTADPDGTDTHGETALHRAAANNQAACIRVLVEHKAKINCVDRNGNSPLHRAAENGHAKACSTLIDLGSNIHLRNKFGDTALHLAARGNHAEMVRDLLLLGGNTTIRNTRGQSITDVARAAGSKDVLNAIREHDKTQSFFSRLKNNWSAKLNDLLKEYGLKK